MVMMIWALTAEAGHRIPTDPHPGPVLDRGGEPPLAVQHLLLLLEVALLAAVGDQRLFEAAQLGRGGPCGGVRDQLSCRGVPPVGGDFDGQRRQVSPESGADRQGDPTVPDRRGQRRQLGPAGLLPARAVGPRYPGRDWRTGRGGLVLHPRGDPRTDRPRRIIRGGDHPTGDGLGQHGRRGPFCQRPQRHQVPEQPRQLVRRHQRQHVAQRERPSRSTPDRAGTRADRVSCCAVVGVGCSAADGVGRTQCPARQGA